MQLQTLALALSIACTVLAPVGFAQVTCSSPGSIGIGANTIALTAQNAGTQRVWVIRSTLSSQIEEVTLHKVGWFRFVPPATGWYSMSVTPCGSTQVAVWESCTPNSTPGTAAVPLAYGCSIGPRNGAMPLARPLQAGVPYLVMIGSTDGSAQPISASLAVTQDPEPAWDVRCSIPQSSSAGLGRHWAIDHLPPQRTRNVTRVDFSTYQTGPLVGQNGWQQFDASSSPALQVISGRATIPATAVDGQDAFLPLARTFAAPTDDSIQETVLNFDLVLNVSSATSSPSEFAAMLRSSAQNPVGNDLSASIAVRSAGSGFVLGTRVNGQAGYLYSFGTQVLVLGQQYAVRAEVHLVRGSANDYVRLYVGNDHDNLVLHSTAGYSGSGEAGDVPAIGAMLLRQSGSAAQAGVSIRSIGTCTDGGARLGVRVGASSTNPGGLVDVELLVDHHPVGRLVNVLGYCLGGTSLPPMVMIDIPSTIYNAAVADRRLILSFGWPSSLAGCPPPTCCPHTYYYSGSFVTIWPGYADCDGDGTSDDCETEPGACAWRARADLNRDDRVDGDDLGLLLAAWGTGGAADLNRDGAVDGNDLGIMLGAWG